MNNKGYTFKLTPERIRFFSKLTPEERLKWLEEAHEFIKSTVPPEKIKRWKAFIKEGDYHKKETS